MNERSSRKKPRDHDFAVNAFRVVQEAIGEAESPTESPQELTTEERHNAAVALGRLGGTSSYRYIAYTELAGKLVERESNLPATADEWVRDNNEKLQRYKDRWVAVTSKGVVAYSSDFDDVYTKAKAKGVSSPLVFKVPSPHTSIKVVSAKLR